ncbi:pepsin/retropepsin-like aspartic protease family protein [Lewinella sp. LCG006]|uniref:pepsin/retropepsin-like aspartic protease family protein n=1 Tax=Lewinella sp. LCG006 TaxID=3231911 RepID=UPI003460E551
MRELWTIILLTLLGNSLLLSQRSIAYLNTPIRPISGEMVTKDDLINLSFQLDRGMIYVKAAVEGQTGDFILDTGAPGLVVNEIPQGATTDYQAKSCSQEVVIGVKPVKSFSWANRTLRNLEAITLDLSHLDKLHNGSVVGMIGYELLKNNTLFIDYQRSQLLLLKNRMNVALAAPSARIPFELYDHLPVIEVVIGGKTLRLGIDTGAATNLLDRNCAHHLSDFLQHGAAEEIQGLDQGVQQVAAARLNGMKASGFDFSGKFLLLDLSHLEMDELHPLDGLLGYQFLSNYRVAIDYPNQEILLWPLVEE